MKSFVRYRHPANGNYYYFVDYRTRSGVLVPVGCFGYRRRRCATIFETKLGAAAVAEHLQSLGYAASVERAYI